MIAYEASQGPSMLEDIRQRTISPEAAQALARIFKAMADPTRVRMLHALSQGELPVCDLAQLIGLSESAVSHQLSLLYALRIVRRRKHGRHVFYALDDEHIRRLIEQGMAHQAHQEAS
ncbi:ArsR/SmtB family transcription factor [Kallotenue papyrolyticum]|uniref:ArsR/SmtB family transcription factor n=1 Tax=Kallotenue papyrolyticum TaxID=1325125 RepID=UPI0005BC53BF|nr:metalloregulator ArsR/SmtB family transcription factor [Kallotenue papyrolyticum]